MRKRRKIEWAIAAGLYFGSIVFAHYRIKQLLEAIGITGVNEISTFRWLYALAYFGFGILLLGTVARVFASAMPAIWRMVALVSGSLLAGLDLWLQYKLGGVTMRVETWMSALMGLAAAVLLVRLLPESLLYRWLGIERRSG